MADIPDEMTIPLDKPIITTAGENVSELRLRAPTAGEWAKADKLTGFDQDIFLVGAVTGATKGSVEGLPAYIVAQAGEYLGSFFARNKPKELGS